MAYKITIAQAAVDSAHLPGKSEVINYWEKYFKENLSPAEVESENPLYEEFMIEVLEYEMN